MMFCCSAGRNPWSSAFTIYLMEVGIFAVEAVVERVLDLRDQVVCCRGPSVPQAGGKRSAEREALEKSRPFKQGQRFRNGIEGRISVLFRGRGMKRALVEGREHFEVLVGAAVLANNLLVIAALLRRTRARRRRPAA